MNSKTNLNGRYRKYRFDAMHQHPTSIRYNVQIALGVTAFWLFLTIPVSAREEILSFVSDIVINQDRSLTVTETIQVNVEGDQIKRGIFRVFPTRYKTAKGRQMNVGFEILSTKRDGRREPYHTEKRSNGVAIYFGQSGVFLAPNIYTYELTYRTTRQLGFFDGYDEIYWNVTGNDWGFPISNARVIVHLPSSARLISADGYTGRQGSKEQSYQVISEFPPTLETTRALNTGEGFTIAIAWPPGYIERPTETEKLKGFVGDNISIGLLFIGVLVVGTYYGWTWHRFGRDPDGGTIIPRFIPPHGFSPAAARFVYLMKYDRTAFTAALINMAVKGTIKIIQLDKDTTIEAKKTDLTVLSSGEHKIWLGLLEGRESLSLKNENHKEIQKAIKSFRETVQAEYESAYFASNKYLFYIGISMSSLFALFGLIAHPDLRIAITSAAVPVILVFLISTLTARYLRVRDISRALVSSYNAWTDIHIQLPILLILGGFFLIQNLWQGIFDSAYFVLYAALATFNALAYHLLKAPTKAGRAIMDEIEGFKMYLATAEQDRLDKLHPPEKTPELFEKLLPYAIALDVENQWADQFEDVLAALKAKGEEYEPVWYSGSNRHNRNFSRSIKTSVSSAVASAATAPGSSSGSSGGGFSGGGGGGGGGGGW